MIGRNVLIKTIPLSIVLSSMLCVRTFRFLFLFFFILNLGWNMTLTCSWKISGDSVFEKSLWAFNSGKAHYVWLEVWHGFLSFGDLWEQNNTLSATAQLEVQGNSPAFGLREVNKRLAQLSLCRPSARPVITSELLLGAGLKCLTTLTVSVKEL